MQEQGNNEISKGHKPQKTILQSHTSKKSEEPYSQDQLCSSPPIKSFLFSCPFTYYLLATHRRTVVVSTDKYAKSSLLSEKKEDFYMQR